MATITPTIELIGSGAVRVTWAGLANGDVGEAVDCSGFSIRSVQRNHVSLGPNEWFAVEGSNDNVIFEGLTGNVGNFTNDVSYDYVNFKSQYLRPGIGGTGTATGVDAILFLSN